jgi:hypothetical protein
MVVILHQHRTSNLKQPKCQLYWVGALITAGRSNLYQAFNEDTPLHTIAQVLCKAHRVPILGSSGKLIQEEFTAPAPPPTNLKQTGRIVNVITQSAFLRWLYPHLMEFGGK